MSSRYPPLPASPPPPLVRARGRPRGRMTNVPTPPRTVRTIVSGATPVTEPISVGTDRTFYPTMAMNTETAERLRQRPVIGNSRFVLRTPTPSYSGMNLSGVPSRPASPGGPSIYSGRDGNLQQIFESALENNDERNRAERDAKRELKAQSKRILKGEFERGQTQRIPFVDEKEAYRQYVLSHSLFPNLYNQRMVMTELGAS